MNQRVATICVALSGLNARGGLRPQGVALGWYVDGPLGRNHNMDRNRNADGIRKNADAFPLNRDNCDRTGQYMPAWGNAPGTDSPNRSQAPTGRNNFTWADSKPEGRPVIG